MAYTKTLLRAMTPPIVWQMARRVRARIPGSAARSKIFEGPFPSWKAAISISDGWDSPVIRDKTLAAALKVRDGVVEFEQDGNASNCIVYSPTILAFLLLTFSRQQENLSIIDFGGGFGSNYFQNRKVIRQLLGTRVQWNVVEQPAFASLGAEYFENAELKFYSTFAEALSSAGPGTDALLFSGSLQYLSEPLALLDEAIEADVRIFGFDRLLVSPFQEHAIFVQHPDVNAHYAATYPVWCFSKDAFVSHLTSRGFSLVEHFTRDPNLHFDHCGMVFVRSG
jgi:putative methyltransferase (TIGR04325 family)